MGSDNKSVVSMNDNLALFVRRIQIKYKKYLNAKHVKKKFKVFFLKLTTITKNYVFIVKQIDASTMSSSVCVVYFKFCRDGY